MLPQICGIVPEALDLLAPRLLVNQRVWLHRALAPGAALMFAQSFLVTVCCARPDHTLPLQRAPPLWHVSAHTYASTHGARVDLLRTHHLCTLLPGMKLNSPCSVAGTRRRRLNSSSQTTALWPLLPQRADWAPRSSLQRVHLVRRRLLLTRLRHRKRLNRAKCSEGHER